MQYDNLTSGHCNNYATVPQLVWPWFWARLIHSAPSHHISLIFLVIFSTSLKKMLWLTQCIFFHPRVTYSLICPNILVYTSFSAPFCTSLFTWETKQRVNVYVFIIRPLNSVLNLVLAGMPWNAFALIFFRTKQEKIWKSPVGVATKLRARRWRN
jgi:hypothetical protein